MNNIKEQQPEKEIIYEGNFIRYVKMGGWEYIERHNCEGIAIIVAMTDDERVIFVEQFRPPVQNNVVEFPAGLINDRPGHKRESLLEGAKRELLEETGYLANELVKLTEGPISAGSHADLVTVVRAYGLEKVSSGGGDETESITIHEVPLSEVDQWLMEKAQNGLMIEPKIYTGLYFLKNYNTAST